MIHGVAIRLASQISTIATTRAPNARSAHQVGSRLTASKRSSGNSRRSAVCSTAKADLTGRAPDLSKLWPVWVDPHVLCGPRHLVQHRSLHGGAAGCRLDRGEVEIGRVLRIVLASYI